MLLILSSTVTLIFGYSEKHLLQVSVSVFFCHTIKWSQI